jgi:hypothetical protein
MIDPCLDLSSIADITQPLIDRQGSVFPTIFVSQLPIADIDFGPLPRQQPRNGAADSIGPSSDNRDTAFQAFSHLTHSLDNGIDRAHSSTSHQAGGARGYSLRPIHPDNSIGW